MPVVQLTNPGAVGIGAPQIRPGDALCTRVRSLSGVQKEALARSARSGEPGAGPPTRGPVSPRPRRDPLPARFLSAGRVARFMNEILALAEFRGRTLRKLRLALDNSTP